MSKVKVFLVSTITATILYILSVFVLKMNYFDPVLLVIVLYIFSLAPAILWAVSFAKVYRVFDRIMMIHNIFGLIMIIIFTAPLICIFYYLDAYIKETP